MNIVSFIIDYSKAITQYLLLLFVFNVNIVFALAPDVYDDASMAGEVQYGNNVKIHACSKGMERSDSKKTFDFEYGSKTIDAASICEAIDPAMYQPGILCSISAPTPDFTTKLEPIKTFVRSDELAVYKCQSGYMWQSFEEIKVIECRTAIWTSIWDKCVREFNISRNCTDIHKLGLDITRSNPYTEYYIVPSGNVTDDPIKVLCYIDPKFKFPYTMLFSRYSADFYVPESLEYTYVSTWNIFVGMKNVHLLTYNATNNNMQPVILWVVAKRSDNNKYESSWFSEFAVDKTGKLISVGNYHGTLGDPLTAYLGSVFDISRKWFGTTDLPGENSVNIFGQGAMNWGKVACKSMKLYIVSSVSYREIYCPLQFGRHPSWPQTTYMDGLHGEQAEGHIFKYECLKESYYEGGDDAFENKTTEGVIECISTPEGLVWDMTRTPKFPCKFDCPPNYVMQSNGERCNYLSNDTVPSIWKAAHSCTADRAGIYSLSKESITNLENATETAAYYNSYDIRYKDPYFKDYDILDDITGMQCEYDNGVCGKFKDQLGNCGLIHNRTLLYFDSCSSEHEYACAIPNGCHRDYKVIRNSGLCYSELFSSATKFLDGVEECNEVAGSYPTPKNLFELEKLVEYVKTRANKPGSRLDFIKIYLGYYSNGQTITTNGLYDLDDEILNKIEKDDSKSYRALVVYQAGNYKIFPVDNDGNLPFTVGNNKKLRICQLYEPVGCAFDSPDAGNNSYKLVDVKSSAPLFTTQKYFCYRGYYSVKKEIGSELFVRANQFLKCYGAFGGYDESSLDSCTRMEVCSTDSFTSQLLDDMNMEADNETYYLDGNLTITCPTGMVTSNGNSYQLFKCVEPQHLVTTNVGDYYRVSEFTFQSSDHLQVVEPCVFCNNEELIFQNSSITQTTTPSLLNLTIVGENVTLECSPGMFFSVGNNEQNIFCYSDGWNTTETNCYEACTAPPPTPMKGLIPLQILNDSIGSQILYSCIDGLNFLPSESFPDIISNITCTCEDDGNWLLEVNTSLICVNVTYYDPVPPCNGSSYSWDNFTRTLKSQVTYTCDDPEESFLFNERRNLTVRALKAGWYPEIPSDEFICQRICPGNFYEPDCFMERDGGNESYWKIVNTLLNYTCVENNTYLMATEQNPELINTTYAYCNDSQMWIKEFDDKKMECYHQTSIDPEPSPENVSISMDWNNYTRIYGHQVMYSCDEPTELLLVNEENNLTVTAGEGGWLPELIKEEMFCFKMCLSELPPGGDTIPDNITETRDKIENATITYRCPDNKFLQTDTQYRPLRRHTYVTCKDLGDWIFEYPGRVLDCADLVPTNPPYPHNSNNIGWDWDGFTREYTTEITYTCDNNDDIFLYNPQIKTITITGNATGWNPDIPQKLLVCAKVCLDQPQPPGDSMILEEISDYSKRSHNAVLDYLCVNDTFLETTDIYRDVRNETSVTCIAPNWITEFTNRDLDCIQGCMSDPPVNVTNSINDWNEYSREVNAQIMYTCHDDHLFPNFLSTWNLTCNNSEWRPLPENLGDFGCEIGCVSPAPSDIGGALPELDNPVAIDGMNLTYNCPNGYATKDGSYQTTITCNVTTWTEAPSIDQFECGKICPGPPPEPTLNATYNYTGDNSDGQFIYYECELDWFLGGLSSFYSKCENHTWTVKHCPECITITTPAPTTVPPIILATLPPYSLKYKDTADLHIGEIEIDFDNIHGEDAEPITTVNSVFGFGTGISLNSTQSQCVEKENFVPMYKRCQINPGECTEGLAFSMWVRPRFGEFDHLHLISDELNIKDRKYFMSTGGDTDGRGGISLYSNKAWITAVASTGPKYWEVTVYGQLAADKWSNLGVRFNMDEFGIELYVNAVLVGATQNYGTADAKPGLDPPTMLLGCFKSADDPEYRNFVDADLDEVAIWEKSINASRVEFFLGGYEANTSNISPDEFAAMIENIDLTDPQQQAAAADLIGKMVASQPDPTIASPTVSTTSNSDPRTTSETASNLIPSMEPMNADGIDTLKSLGHIIQKITDYTKVPNIMTEETATQFLKLLGTVSNLLKPENGKLWQGVHGITEEVGVMQLVNGVTKWKSAIMKSLDYTNVTKPICFEAIENSLYSKSCKMTIKDYRAMGTKIQEPNYNQPKLMKMRKKWDGFIVDRIVFPTDIFTDNRCLNRPVSFDATIYDTVSSSAQTPVNPMYLDRNTPKSVDARLLSITLTVDRARDINGDIDTSQPICEPDGEAMKMSTVMIHAEHETKSPAVYVEKRKLLLFEEVIETNIQQRFCVWWNENITDFGAWDKSGCELIETNLEYSKCACSNFGILTVLAVNTEKIEVPDDPEWLGPVRLALYAVSALAIIVYIILVIASGDLKDQFHLMGVNLAVAILFGSITMLITDFESIRKDRSNCAILGALIQLFYGAVGTWMLGLAHASFRGITSGVIGGCLNGYMLICWGLPIAFTGIPFILFNPMNLGNDPRCFIAWDEYVKSIFFMPQMFCVILGLFWALVVLFNLSTPALRKDNLIEDYGSFCRGAAMLVMFLAMTWSFGFLTYLPILDEPNFYPIFQVLNAVAGLCLLIFIGFGSTRFKSVLKGQAEMRREKIKKFAFGLPAIETVKKDTIGSADVVSNFDN